MLKSIDLSDKTTFSSPPPLEEIKAESEMKWVGEREIKNISLVYKNKKIEYLRDLKADTTRSGTWAIIFQATYGNRTVAIREMSIETCRENFESPRSLHTQIAILKKINSPYLLTPKFDFIQIKSSDSKDSVYYCQVMEYINGPTLEAYCYSEAAQKISLLEMYIIAYQIAQGIAALHTQKPPLVHCDLHGKNILLDENLNAKIIDFDLFGPAGKRKMWLNDRRAAPEQEDSPTPSFTTQTDIHSLGKIFLLLVIRKYSSDDSFRPSEVRAKSSLEFTRLIQSCLATKPAKRATAQQICTQLEKMITLEIASQKDLQAVGPQPKSSLPAQSHPLSLLGLFAKHCDHSLMQPISWAHGKITLLNN